MAGEGQELNQDYVGGGLGGHAFKNAIKGTRTCCYKVAFNSWALAVLSKVLSVSVVQARRARYTTQNIMCMCML